MIISGYIKIQNNSSFDWKNVEIVLNPPNNDFGGLVDVISNGIFRAPANSDKYYFIDSNDYIKVNFDEFTHSKTKEKFNSDKYQLIKYMVRIEVYYKGEYFPFSNT